MKCEQNIIVNWIIISLFFKSFEDVLCECIFPEYLWMPRSSTAQRRLWTTETKYRGDKKEWDSQKIIEVSKTQIETRARYPVTCDKEVGYDGRCFSEDVMNVRYCLFTFEGGKFKVQQGELGNEKYTCMKFVQRSYNVVSVWIAQLRPVLTDSICDDANLLRVDWPWIDEGENNIWTPCAFSGGFNFNAYINERKKRLCHRVWRPSRLESECITGDGLHFLFPEKSCSPFINKETSEVLRCWANWSEGMFIYLLLGNQNRPPQYVMRLPYNFESRSAYNGKLYFNPVAPIDERGLPPGNIMHVLLEFTRSESGVCVDESKDVCEEYAKDGKCKDGGLHEIGHYCKNSCGLCNLAPSETAECHFPLPIQGEWLLFERERKEEVSIRGGQIIFSHSGTFVCKTKHWTMNRYKLLSVFNNGCRARFTCVEFKYVEHGNVLRYRLSSSERSDNSFDLCEFDDDPPPLGEMYRSEEYKVLLPLSRTVLKSCGLGGLVYVNAMMTETTESCHATLSDWNPFSCMASSTMTLSFRSCDTDFPPEQEEYKCQAYVDMQDDFRLLITSQIHQEEIYSCWVIKINPFSQATEPWKRAYILKRAQCGAPEDLDPLIYKPAEITFQIYSKNLERDCIVVNKVSTKPTTIRSIYNNNKDKMSVIDDSQWRHLATAQSRARENRPSDASKNILELKTFFILISHLIFIKNYSTPLNLL